MRWVDTSVIVHLNYLYKGGEKLTEVSIQLYISDLLGHGTWPLYVVANTASHENKATLDAA